MPAGPGPSPRRPPACTSANRCSAAWRKIGSSICPLTLHTGAGTFRPIAAPLLAEHKMHAEWGMIRQEIADRILQCRAGGGRVVAVGTTSVRLLETAAADGMLKPFTGYTDLFIRPPFQFHVVDALLTNFHLPRTTLLVLVRTFGGDALIARAYEEAIREGYRFYSYGDAMLICKRICVPEEKLPGPFPTRNH